MPILATLGMLAVWFHYEKITKYNFGITPNQTYEAISLLVIAILVIAIRVFTIVKAYLENQEILQAKNTNIKS